MGYKQQTKVEHDLQDLLAEGQTLTREQRKLMDKLVRERMPTSCVDLFEKRKAKCERQGYLIDKVWPQGTVHLIAGPSGIGKSTWLLKTIHDWEHGVPIMGFPSNPLPYVYLMCYRSEVDLQRTLNRIGLGAWHINAYSIESLGQEPFYMEPSDVDIENLPEIFPWAKVFFIEAINWFYKNRSSSASRDYVDTLRFWSHVRDRFCENDLTVIGTTHVPKMKQNEAYARPRDKVHGNVGQPAVAGTIILMDDNPKDRDQVFLTVCARDTREFVVEYRRNRETGILEFTAGVDDTNLDPGAFALLDRRLDQIQPEGIVDARTILEWHKAIGVSRMTANRWIRAKVDAGRLLKLERGKWSIKKAIIN